MSYFSITDGDESRHRFWQRPQVRYFMWAFTLLIAVFLVVQFLKWNDHEAKLQLIKPGMTFEEVQANLGGPPGNYSAKTYSARNHYPFEPIVVNDPGDVFFYWNFNDGTAEVGTTNGIVISARWYQHDRTSQEQYIRDFLKNLGLR